MKSNNLRNFNMLRVNELTVTRSGMVNPRFELSDGQFTYGTLSFSGWTKRTAVLETATDTWQIVRKGMFSRVFYISRNEAQIGTITPGFWSRKISIELNDGVSVNFTKKKVFTRAFTILNDQYGDMITIQPEIWKFSKPFNISFNQNLVKIMPEFPLLILSGVYLTLLRKRQAAAAAAH